MDSKEVKTNLKLYGFYSKEHARISGITYIYTTPGGSDMWVTHVGPDPTAKAYVYSDKEGVGEVLEFVKRLP